MARGRGCGPDRLEIRPFSAFSWYRSAVKHSGGLPDRLLTALYIALNTTDRISNWLNLTFSTKNGRKNWRRRKRRKKNCSARPNTRSRTRLQKMRRRRQPRKTVQRRTLRNSTIPRFPTGSQAHSLMLRQAAARPRPESARIITVRPSLQTDAGNRCSASRAPSSPSENHHA